MRLVSYDREGERRLGALFDGAVIDLPDAVGHPAFPSTMEALLARHGGTTMDAARAAFEHDDVMDFVVHRPRFLAPVLPAPAVGDAAAARPRLVGGAVATLTRVRPSRPRASTRGSSQTIRWPAGTSRLDVELQVACVVGLHGRRLTEHEAGGGIFGYAASVTWSAAGRAVPLATSLGPWLATADDFDPTARLAISVDGDPRAEASLGAMSASFAGLVARASRSRELEPGDLVGSAAGESRCVARLDHRKDAGVEVSFEVEGLGSFRQRLQPPA